MSRLTCGGGESTRQVNVTGWTGAGEWEGVAGVGGSRGGCPAVLVSFPGTVLKHHDPKRLTGAEFMVLESESIMAGRAWREVAET